MSSGYLWVKALHIIFVTCWFAGLFYLPRIFVNLAMAGDTNQVNRAEIDRLLLMARKLYRFMGPLMLLALVFGLWLWLGYGIGKSSLWLPAKLLIVIGLIAYHIYCGRLLKQFEQSANLRGHVWFRWFNEAPVLGLFLAVLLVVLKPF
jgi:putative membrane protein